MRTRVIGCTGIIGNIHDVATHPRCGRHPVQRSPDIRRSGEAAKTDTDKKTIGLTYNKVEGLKAPKLGDESVGYRITGDIGKQKVPMTYTVVRSGGVIAAFYGGNMLDQNQAAIPEAVVKDQLDRL